MITVRGRCGGVYYEMGWLEPFDLLEMRMPLGIVPEGEAPHIQDTGECGGISCRICSLSGCSSCRPGCRLGLSWGLFGWCYPLMLGGRGAGFFPLRGGGW